MFSKTGRRLHTTFQGLPASPRDLRCYEHTHAIAFCRNQKKRPGAESDLNAALSGIVRERAGALFVFDDVLMMTHKTQILNSAAKVRLPVISQYAELTEAGGLMAYGPDVSDMYRRAATYVDKILKGTRPADLPIEQPTKVQLVINLKTAKALGLTIPQTLLLQADQSIQ
jgi:ABC-type uncharacterized transport system substrate-binding protein